MRLQAEIRADYFQLLFIDAEAGDEDLEAHWTDAAQDLRLAPVPGGFMVATLSDGPNDVDLEEVAAEPPATGLADWDHVARAAVELPSGRLAVTGPTGVDAVGVRLAPGRYGIQARFLDFATPRPRCSVRLWASETAMPQAELTATSGHPVDATDAAIRRHLRAEWPGRPLTEFEYAAGPIRESVPGFRVLRFGPAAGLGDWIYVSSGASRSAQTGAVGSEFAIRTDIEDALFVELLAAVADYDAQPHFSLEPGRVLPLGRPWLENSTLDHLAFAAAWPDTPALPALAAVDRQVEFVWARLVDAGEADALRAR